MPKISEYTDASTLTGFYAVGTQEQNNTLVTCKYNLGTFYDQVQTGINGIIAPESIDAFSNTRNYYPGQFCLYNNKTWKFIKVHYKNTNWIDGDAVETTVLTEINKAMSCDTETLHVNVSSSDGQMSVSGTSVTVTYLDTSTNTVITLDSDGNGSTTISKGRPYKVTAPQRLGYQYPGDFLDMTATITDRYLNFVYTAGSVPTESSVIIHLNMIRGSAADYNDQPVSLLLSDNTVKSATFSSGVATITNIPRGLNATMTMPVVTNYRKPRDKYFAINDTSIEFYVNCENVTSFGIFAVDGSTWEEVPLADVSTTWNTQHAGHECVSLHVKTQDLVQNGDDYWVRLIDLTTQSNLPSGQWQSDETYLLPHVSTDGTYTNGELMTYYMLKDCYDTNRTSGIAINVINSKYLHNNKTCSGFILTYSQLNILMLMHQDIYNILLFFGYTGNYKSRFLWTSTQNRNDFAIAWLSNYSVFSYANKKSNIATIPAFSRKN